MRRFEVLTAEWETESSDRDYSRIEREGEAIETGEPPRGGACYFYEFWHIDGRCVACGVVAKLMRYYSDAEDWYEWFIPSDKKYDPNNPDIYAWTIVEYRYGSKRDPSGYCVEITDQNRWLETIAKEIEAEENKSD